MLSDVMLANANTAKPEFVADREGTYTFRLSVNDGKLQSTDDVTVTVVGETNTSLPSRPSPHPILAGGAGTPL